MPEEQHQPPPGEDKELRRKIILAVVQGLAREALEILLREVWRYRPW